MFIDEVAVYEHALRPDRVLAHYQAGAERGLSSRTAGESIAAVADTGLWAETDIDTGYHHEVIPVMSRGQSRMEAIKDAVRPEFPMALFYFPAPPTPAIWAGTTATRARTTRCRRSSATTAAERFRSLEFDTTDEDELYNVVTVAREGGWRKPPQTRRRRLSFSAAPTTSPA